jgi:hypothetical protein
LCRFGTRRISESLRRRARLEAVPLTKEPGHGAFGRGGELSEIFQWLTEDASKGASRDPSCAQAIKDELADVLIYLVRLSDVLDVDLNAAVLHKLKINASKYPVSKARGTSRSTPRYEPSSRKTVIVYQSDKTQFVHDTEDREIDELIHDRYRAKTGKSVGIEGADLLCPVGGLEGQISTGRGQEATDVLAALVIEPDLAAVVDRKAVLGREVGVAQSVRGA